MQTTKEEPTTPFAETVYTGDALVSAYLPEPRPVEDAVAELWVWVQGLSSFLSSYDRVLGDSNKPVAVTRDRKGEFHVTMEVFIRLSGLLAEIANSDQEEFYGVRIERRVFSELSSFVQDHSVLNTALLKGDSLSYFEWRSWRKLLREKLVGLAAVELLEDAAAEAGVQKLPERLRGLADNPSFSLSDRSTIRWSMSRLGRILLSLGAISQMLKNDDPLKPAIAIFCGIHDQVRTMNRRIGDTLSRWKDEEAELFGMLDGASYMASLELKKAYNQELAGIVTLRSALVVYARVETAFALLNDGFQEILTGFVRLVEPQVTVGDVFPEFQHKLAESLMLRNHLHQVVTAVRNSEEKPTPENVESLQTILSTFLNEPIEYLYYKDREAFERFCEEINASIDGNELVPLLHRFSAYLETLFRQVSMRAVLVDHPFEASI